MLKYELATLIKSVVVVINEVATFIASVGKVKFEEVIVPMIANMDPFVIAIGKFRVKLEIYNVALLNSYEMRYDEAIEVMD